METKQKLMHDFVISYLQLLCRIMLWRILTSIGTLRKISYSSARFIRKPRNFFPSISSIGSASSNFNRKLILAELIDDSMRHLSWSDRFNKTGSWSNSALVPSSTCAYRSGGGRSISVCRSSICHYSFKNSPLVCCACHIIVKENYGGTTRFREHFSQCQGKVSMILTFSKNKAHL